MVDLKKSLIAISWAMPPLVYPRAIQVSRSLKELARRGWSIDVVALDAGSSPDDTPDTAFADHYSRFYCLSSIDTKDVQTIAARHPKICRFLKNRFGYFEPSAWAWERRARSKAIDLIKANRPQVLLTFAQPWVDHLVGLSIKHRFPSLPWVAHFSDPWVDGPYVKRADPELLRRWRRQERKIIEAADAVIFVNDSAARLVMSKYPEAWRHKVRTVPHGFDPELLPKNSSRARQSERMRLVYTGSLFDGLRDPVQILKAISCLKSMVPRERMPVIEFVGSGGEQYQPRSQELGVSDIVRFSGRTTYLQALQIASESDMLLVIDTIMNDNVFFPSKIVDYLMFDKPILALTSQNSVTANILGPLGHMCIDADDPLAVARALAGAVDGHYRSGMICDSYRLAATNYHISSTTDGLEAAIHTAVEKRQSVG